MKRDPLSVIVASIVYGHCLDCREQSLAVLGGFDAPLEFNRVCRASLERGAA